MIAWPWVLWMLAVVGIVGYVYGSVQRTRDQDERLEHAVNRAGTTGTAVRYLYALLELPPPDLDERPEPEYAPRWWQRLGAWYRRPSDIPAPIVAANDAEPADEEHSEFDTDEIPAQPVTQPDMKAAHKVEPPRTLEQILAEFGAARADVQAQRRELDAAEWGAG